MNATQDQNSAAPMSLYELKPRFQQLLRPAVGALARLGVTANQVTLLAAAISLLIGFALCWFSHISVLFLALPVWLLVRMAFNAVDGMLAREHGQQSKLGAYLNELTDVVSDSALYLPLAFVAPFQWSALMLFILLAALTEMAGILGQTVGASRRYDGPLGKSDRAFVVGALGFWIAIGSPLPPSLWLLPWALSLLCAITVVNRVRKGLHEAP